MEIYPMYYLHGAVLFFAEHHSDENIMRDIRTGKVTWTFKSEVVFQFYRPRIMKNSEKIVKF